MANYDRSGRPILRPFDTTNDYQDKKKLNSYRSGVIFSGALIVFGYILTIFPVQENYYNLFYVTTYPYKGFGELLIVIGVVTILVSIFLYAAETRKPQCQHSPSYDPSQPVQQQPVRKLFCKECGHSILLDTEICSYCGYNIKENKKTNFCPSCGVKLDGFPVFCFKCGYKMR